jgi:hypothetical protein
MPVTPQCTNILYSSNTATASIEEDKAEAA